MPAAPAKTRTWTFFENQWHEGNVPIMGPRTHAAWLCSVVFDGARYFEGVTPDLELHCTRVNDSAKKMFLKPIVSPETWVKLAREGISRFDKNAAPTFARCTGQRMTVHGYKRMIRSRPGGVSLSMKPRCASQRVSR